MNVDVAVVQQIVTEVLTRLGLPIEAKQDRPPDSANQDGQAGETPQSNSERVELSEKVITASLLESRINGASRIVIDAESILTPSARDFLRTHKIAYCRRETQTPSQGLEQEQIPGCWRVVTMSHHSALKRILDDLDQVSNANWSKTVVDHTDDIVSQAVDTLCREQADGVVAFSQQSELIACQSNRNQRVRAAVISDARRIGPIQRQMGANLIVINPDEKNYFELKSLLEAVAKAGKPNKPADLSE